MENLVFAFDVTPRELFLLTLMSIMVILQLFLLWSMSVMAGMLADLTKLTRSTLFGLPGEMSMRRNVVAITEAQRKRPMGVPPVGPEGGVA